MNEDEFRDALHSTTPNAPEVSAWAGTARRRSIRTRGLVAAGMVVAVTVAGAFLIGNLRPGATAGIPAAPATSSPSATAATLDCDRDGSLPAAPPQLPTGASEVQLCPDGYDPDTTVLTPVEPLTEGVTELVDAINAAPLVPLPSSCADEFWRTFRVAILYPDGTRITLIGSVGSDGMDSRTPRSCDRLGRDGAWRSGELLNSLRSAWLHQRGDTRTGQPFQTPDCSRMSPSLFSAELGEVSTTIVCGPGGSSQPSPAVLTAEQTQELTADIAARTHPQGNDSQDFPTTMNLFTPWGEVITLYKAGLTDSWGFLNDKRSGQMWTPSPAIRAWLDPLIDGASTPTSGSSTDCTAYTQPTGGDIPADALTLRLCALTGDPQLEPYTPVEALGPDGAHSVLAVLLKRPKLDSTGTCSLELGPAFLLIAEYSGREPVVMELQAYGCHPVGTTTDRRTGATDVLAAFRTALAAQRAKDPGSTAVRGGTLCAPAAYMERSSVMPVRLADATGGSICGYADRSSASLQAERVLDAEAFARIKADLAANSSRGTPPRCSSDPPGTPGVALVLTNRWGDVLSIRDDECAGTYSYTRDGKNVRWQPSGDVATLLAKLVR